MNEQDLVPWLLQATTPSIRYITLRRLLGRPEHDPEVQAAWLEMEATGPIPTILAGQTPAGNWAGERSYYTPKYVSTHWSMLLLAELAADDSDPRLQQGAAFMLAATREELEQYGREQRYNFSCFYGNLLRYALHCGFADDARVQGVVDYLANDARTGWRCVINDDVPCAWGAARALWGLAALPAADRSAEVEAAIEGGLVFLLEGGRLAAGEYPGPRVHSLWKRLNFPLFYQADVLFVLRVLEELGTLDRPGAQEALEWLAGGRRKNGRWRGAGPFRRRTWRGLFPPEETDRWVSLHAAVVLQAR